MRKNILAAGVILLGVAIVFGVSYPPGLLFSLPISTLNILLGILTRALPGIEIQPPFAGIRLVIDRGVVRASIYQLVFLNSKLILKRLSSVTVTVILAFVLAVVGLEVLGLIGALMGGITGFSLQEFLTQRMRNQSERLRLRRKRMKRASSPVATVASSPAANTLLGSMNNAPRPSMDST